MLAGHAVRLVEIDLGPRAVRLCTVEDLESTVDRGALLRGESEPPYWAHLWSGARVLAAYVARWLPVRDRRVLEIGCGLGLPAVTAAALGARVSVVDEQQAALDFVAASAAANGVACEAWRGDFITLDPTWQCDVLLAAEVVYDATRFAAVAAVFERHLATDGVALVADGYRTDTRGFYRALMRRGLSTHAVDVRVVEEGRAVPVRLCVIRRPDGAITPPGSRRPPA